VIVVVEDSEACAVTLQIALEMLPGVEVRTVSNGLDALAMLEQCSDPVAAIITDFQLPGMNGLDLVERLRTDSRYACVPVLIISGNSDPDIPERALSSGAHAFFVKPYSPSEVRKRLEQLLKW
jgi:CheY-like chemotaxis protein